MLFVPVFTILLGATTAANVDNIFRPFVSNDTEILPFADISNISDLSQRWDVLYEPTYLGAVKPAGEKDLQAIVKIASARGIPFLATGGGHGVSATLDNLRNGLDIDLGNFKSVHLDIERNRLTVGGAVHFGDVIDLLYNSSREIPITASPCVGMLGATLGAGIGIMQGIRGPLLDSLESVRLVTASGQIVTASEGENEELFWALRGAGHNFGIITSATYRVYLATNDGQVTNADFLFLAPQNGSVWSYMASLDDTLPAELAFTFFVSRNPLTPNSTVPIIAVNAAYFGPQAEALPHLQPLIDLGPVMSNISTVPLNEELGAQFFGISAGNGACDTGNIVNVYGLALKHTDASAWETHFNDLTSFFHEYPEYEGRVLIQRFPNQAAVAVADSATAYPHREAKIHLSMEGWYTNRSLDDAVNAFLDASRAKFQQTSGFSEQAVYVNYAHGDEGPVAWYSSRKLHKLKALKTRWDPTGLFNWYNPIA
ncbi:FAD binding domain family protein [Pleurostoma richardsiae]|uniref:FAD binding domain family protein n=1 Tax=Pleurostoma richardsiae TaxID=41990 RepID=A0AA38VUD3_9PEZI|nr:FAD binding domain family protein [Pleurostoma richardsiae]